MTMLMMTSAPVSRCSQPQNSASILPQLVLVQPQPCSCPSSQVFKCVSAPDDVDLRGWHREGTMVEWQLLDHIKNISVLVLLMMTSPDDVRHHMMTRRRQWWCLQTLISATSHTTAEAAAQPTASAEMTQISTSRKVSNQWKAKGCRATGFLNKETDQYCKVEQYSLYQVDRTSLTWRLRKYLPSWQREDGRK